MYTSTNWEKIKLRRESDFMNILNENIKGEKIVELLKRADDDGTFYDSLYKLYVLIGIAKGVDDINNNSGMTLEEFNNEREAIYERYSRKLG